MEILTNEERKESLKIFSTLYAPRDYEVMINHMPNEISDPGGKDFDDYFDFLQSLYALRSDIKVFEDEYELDQRLENLASWGKTYDYPLNILEGFYG